jgi:hypothetical protein
MIAIPIMLVVHPIFDAVVWAHLVGVAQKALYISVLRARQIGFVPAHIFPFDSSFFNRDLFTATFVETVMAAGPWILIARHIRRHPMRLPVDDGSPWPRRYCGRCMYNLHGIDAATCPECGRTLIE